MGLLRHRRNSTDAHHVETTREPGRLAMPRSRGAFSGLLLVLLGAFGALVPLVGPYFNLTIGSDQAWDVTNGRLLLSILPGAAAVLGGLMLMYSANRATATFGAWLALAAGAWFVVGPTVSMLWNGGQPQTGDPLGGTNQQVLEWLLYFYGLGAAITAIAGIALGKVTTRSVRDVERLTTTAPAEPATQPAGGRFSRRRDRDTVDEPAMRHTREDDTTVRR